MITSKFFTCHVLSWHVQKFVGICWPGLELQQANFPSIVMQKSLVKRVPSYELNNHSNASISVVVNRGKQSQTLQPSTGIWMSRSCNKLSFPCWMLAVSWLLMGGVNSSPPCAEYMHWWTGSALVEVMACRLFGAKPLPEPMLTYCQLYA